ncbi:hypothetical protein ACJMK2_037881 [Sinanodonta woodiana]|uniref:Nesprin-1 n=1 Tax=Sinanodonta woodiana TaxID=1069815 RepID=A0ABD3WLU5_SINWO
MPIEFVKTAKTPSFKPLQKSENILSPQQSKGITGSKMSSSLEMLSAGSQEKSGITSFTDFMESPSYDKKGREISPSTTDKISYKTRSKNLSNGPGSFTAGPDSGVFLSQSSSPDTATVGEKEFSATMPKSHVAAVPKTSSPFRRESGSVQPGPSQMSDQHFVPSSVASSITTAHSDTESMSEPSSSFSLLFDSSAKSLTPEPPKFTQSIPSSERDTLKRPTFVRGLGPVKVSRKEPIQFDVIRPSKENKLEHLQSHSKVKDRARSPSSRSFEGDVENSYKPKIAASKPEDKHSNDLSPRTETLSRHTRSLSPSTVAQSIRRRGSAGLVPEGKFEKQQYIPPQMRSLSPKHSLLTEKKTMEVPMEADGACMDMVSKSVPSLLELHVEETRGRSSSFGSNALSPTRGLLRKSRVRDLSSSWQNLQKQDAEQEIESIREDIARVRERGHMIMETSDPEGCHAMHTTLAMLTDKIESLQAMSDDTAKQLQNAIREREKHDITLTAYKKHVTELENWAEEVKVRQAVTPLPTDSTGALQEQLLENKDLQEELNQKLQQVADLAIQCDSLCELEPPAAAEKLRSQLSNLQQSLGNLKLAAIEKQDPLRTSIRESEKRRREMDDYETNVKKLQQWMADTKKLASAPSTSEPSFTAAEQQELQQQLESDLSQHRQLVRQLSSEMRIRDAGPHKFARVKVLPPISEEDLKTRWESLSKELEQKKQNLDEIIEQAKELVGPGQYGSRKYRGQDSDTSSQLKDVRGHLNELGNLWQQLQVQVQDRQLRLDQALEFQQKYQEALQNVSRWLDMAEQKLFNPDPNTDSEEKLKKNEDLQREIKSLQGEIQSMSHAAQELLAIANRDSHNLIQQSLQNLSNRVVALESHAQQQGEKLRAVDRRYKQFQEEVENLEKKLAETKQMMSSASPTASLDSLISNMQKIEAQLKKCEVQLEELKQRQSELSSLDPELVSPQTVDVLQSTYMDLQRKAMEQKAYLMQSVSVQEQYEKLLQDYSDFLDTAQDKLSTESISARDLEHLKQQLNAHKDFFGDLEVHRAMLDSLAAQCDRATKQKHLPTHTRLSNLTYVLQDRASLHGQRLDRLVRQWAEIDEKFHQLQRFLDDIDQQIPRPVSNEDSFHAIQTKINTYQRLQRELNDEKPTVFQIVDKGKQLLHSVNCPALETMITELADKWVDLNASLSQELKRTQSLGDQLQTFEADATVLRSWLTTERTKLTGIKQLSEVDLKSIATVRNKTDKLLEFRKEVENQEPLKEKVISVGNQLMQNKVYKSADLEDRLSWLQEEWAQLQHDINKVEEHLHQAQMDLMPSRQALGELNSWLNAIEKSLRDDKNKTMKSIADLEVILKKYKNYKIDLSSKQLTVDFVNQEVLQPKDDTDSPAPSERNEFSERLGSLNSRWQTVSRHVSDRLKMLEAMNARWDEYERTLGILVSWIKEHEDKLKKYRLIGQEVGVRQTLKDCKALKQTLKSKETDVNSVKTIGETLVQLSADHPGCQKSIQESLSNFENQWHHLHSQVDQVQVLLEDMLTQWNCYHNELTAITQTLAETEYCLQRYTMIGGDIATLKIQVEKLENLMSDMDRLGPRHEKFVALATRLSQVCEAPVRQEIQTTQEDIQGRWQHMFSELHQRTNKFRDCLQQWLLYEDQYTHAKTWLDAKERLCDDLVYAREDTGRRDENLLQSRTLQKELDNFQMQISELYRISDEVTRNMDPSSIVSITSRLMGLDQRLLSLRQKLGKHIQSLQGDMSQQNRFLEAFASMNAFLSQAERILGMDDPNKSADEDTMRECLDHLKELLNQFNVNYQKLDALNDLGYRLALSEMSASDLNELNHKWHRLFAETSERCKTLQGMVLLKQDLTQKCDTWMTFLAQTEQDLAMEITGNLADLQDQQRKCEKFESEIYSRQQILHAIISDGQKMLKDGDVEDREEFQQKLHLLTEQWQSVLRRANQRKAIIDNTIKQWNGFNDLVEKLRNWLREKEEELQAFDFSTASIQRIKNLVEKAKHTQNEFKLQDDLFKKMNEQGKQLLQRADRMAAEEIRVNMAQLQQHWHQIFEKVDEHRERLDGILKQWTECEEDIEAIQAWLKDIRTNLGKDIATAYDELQADHHRCKDIETSFTNSEDKRQTLLAKEKVLSHVVQPDDMNILHQRIRLLNKQWDELRSQVELRSQRVHDNMVRWSSFNEKVRDLCDWMDQMEVKVISCTDYHIEDLLNRIDKDFREEMIEKEKLKNELVDQGRRLIKISSEVRANDIEQKITRLEDRWTHLKAVTGFRQRKLQETLLAVQQLDTSMSNLRKWLADIESELSVPVVYEECDIKEIKKKLKHQQDWHQDIERHSAGVGSVLNLCEVLLHDSDACPTQVEFNALQTAMKNLDRRWRNICQMSPEQKEKIEETWQLWQDLLADCKRFDDWLNAVEREVRETSPSQLNVSLGKEEYRKCDALQREVHENLRQLENINKQYRLLAREGRTDRLGMLKNKMQEANDRWDQLQLQMSGIMRKMKQSSAIRQDFTSTRDSLLAWLSEIDVQLTNMEQLSSMDTRNKLREIQRIKDEVDSHQKKFDYLDEAGLYLIQKGDSSDALTVQAELDEFHKYQRQVLDRVAIFYAVVCRVADAQVEDIGGLERSPHYHDDDLDHLEHDLYADHPDSKYPLEWDTKDLEAYLEASPPESPPEKRRAMLRQRQSRSPVRTPRSESPKPRPRSPKSPRRVVSGVLESNGLSREERYQRLRGDLTQRAKEEKVEELLEKLVDALEDASEKLTLAEAETRSHIPTGPGVELQSDTYVSHI